MTLKDGAKFNGKLTYGLKNDIRYLVSFHASSQRSGNFHFDGLLLLKVCNVWDKKNIEELCRKKWFMISKNDINKKFGEFSQK